MKYSTIMVLWRNLLASVRISLFSLLKRVQISQEIIKILYEKLVALSENANEIRQSVSTELVFVPHFVITLKIT